MTGRLPSPETLAEWGAAVLERITTDANDDAAYWTTVCRSNRAVIYEAALLQCEELFADAVHAGETVDPANIVDRAAALTKIWWLMDFRRGQ